MRRILRSTLSFVPLENEASNDGNHWEMRVLRDEIMVAQPAGPPSMVLGLYAAS